MFKSKTTASAPRVKITGADAADRQQIAAARKANADDAAADRKTSDTDAASAKENTKTTTASPEAAPTPREARDAAQKLFDKADEEGKAELIATASMQRAVLGY